MVGAPGDGWVERGVETATSLLGGGPWESTTLHGTGGGLFGSSVARLRSGSESVIVKTVLRNDAGSADAASWRREYDLYRSGWLAESLPEGLAAPDCLAATTNDDAAVIVLEDVEFDDRDTRPVEWYGRLAERLGRLNATEVRDVPAWASRGFVASEAAELTSAVPASAWQIAPPIADVVVGWPALLDRLAAVTPALLSRLDEGRTGFHHLDAFSRNVAEVRDRMLLIDWAYAGIAPIGSDAAGVVVITAVHGDVGRHRVAELYRSVVDGFTSGIVESGLDVDDVEATIDALIVLRWARFLTQVVGLGDRIVEVAEEVTDRPFDEVLAALEATSDFMKPLAERVVDAA